MSLNKEFYVKQSFIQFFELLYKKTFCIQHPYLLNDSFNINSN